MANKTNQAKLRITEQEKQENPIFSAIYKRIRNLNKKLLDIQNLQKRGKETLKPQQLVKVEKKFQVVKQIEKNEQFALFYKGIIQQSETAVSERVKTDDLIKIATLLVVGQSIEKHNNCPSSDNLLLQAFNSFYTTITQNPKKNDDQSQRIKDIVNLLSDYLKSSKLHSACKDYITFSTESQNKNEQNRAKTPFKKIQKVVQQQKKSEQPCKEQEQKKENPKSSYKENSQRKQGQKNHQHKEQPKSWNQMNSSSQQNNEKQRQAQTQNTKKEQKKVLNENKRVDSKSETNQLHKEEIKKQQPDQQNKDKRESNNNRPVRSNYNTNNYSNYQRTDNRDIQNRRPYNNRNGYNNTKYNDNQNRRKYYDYDRTQNQRDGRKFQDNQEWKNKKKYQKNINDSDSSLEPTPEKRNDKKPKFVAKQ